MNFCSENGYGWSFERREEVASEGGNDIVANEL